MPQSTPISRTATLTNDTRELTGRKGKGQLRLVHARVLHSRRRLGARPLAVRAAAPVLVVEADGDLDCNSQRAARALPGGRGRRHPPRQRLVGAAQAELGPALWRLHLVPALQVHRRRGGVPPQIWHERGCCWPVCYSWGCGAEYVYVFLPLLWIGY